MTRLGTGRKGNKALRQWRSESTRDSNLWRRGKDARLINNGVGARELLSLRTNIKLKKYFLYKWIEFCIQ